MLSTQILATLPGFAPALVPRNYYSQSRKDAPVTLVVDQKFFSRNGALRGMDALNGLRNCWLVLGPPLVRLLHAHSSVRLNAKG
jgi:hypothetical protein